MNFLIIFGGSSFEHEISIVSAITLKEKIKFYRNVVFAVMSADVWNSYNVPMAKGFFINVLGIIFALIILLRIKFLEAKENSLIEQLKDLE